MKVKPILFLLIAITVSCSSSKEKMGIEQTEELVSDEKNEEVKDSTSMEDKSLKFIALGDSYTIGESVVENLSWPAQLTQALSKEGVVFDEGSPMIIAKTGWTTDELTSAIGAADLSKDYDLVSLLIGVNNQYRGYDVAVYVSEYENLLKQAIEFANGDVSKVFVVSIPDWGAMPFAEGRDRAQIAKEIDQYNNIKTDISERYGVQYFDITPISRQALQNNELVASDGLHPSAQMYSLWVELILPWAKEALGK